MPDMSKMMTQTKKGHSGPVGWGLDVELTNPPQYFVEKPLKLEDEAMGFSAGKRGRRVRLLRFKTELCGIKAN
jgi:hypothetical protein